MNVQFPGPAVITQNGDISYKAVVDGETIPCRFSTEALEDIDPANRMDDVMSLFEANKPELLGIAEKRFAKEKSKTERYMCSPRIYQPNETLQLTARSAAALRVPYTVFGCSGGN